MTCSRSARKPTPVECRFRVVRKTARNDSTCQHGVTLGEHESGRSIADVYLYDAQLRKISRERYDTFSVSPNTPARATNVLIVARVD